MVQTKVRKIGNSLGIILPKDLLDLLGVSDGDEIEISIEEGTVKIVLNRRN